MKKVYASLVFLLIFSACANAPNTNQKKFGIDSNYFIALQNSESGNESEAIRLLKITRKKGSSLISKRSAQALTLLGSINDKISAAEFLAANFDDEKSLITACSELYDHGEYVKVINLTENLSLENSKNELIKLRLHSLAQKRDSRFDAEFFKWFISRPLSSEHLETYPLYITLLNEKNKNIGNETEKFQKDLNKRSILESQLAPDYPSVSDDEKSTDVQNAVSIVPDGGFEPLFDALQEAENPQKIIMDFRIAVFHRSYKLTFSLIDKIFQIYKNLDEEIDSQLLSDIGKATLYGTDDFLKSAQKFDALAKNLSPEKAYFAHFYAARLYDKAGRYQNQTVSRFKNALASTEDFLQFDNCLWYLLNFQLRTSTDDIISTLEEYGSQIHDAEYFDDFFESLSILLLSSHRWQDFFRVWKQTNSNFSEYTAGKYAYISGRLIEEGLAQGDDGLKTRQTVEAFTQVLNGKSSLYYKICALERLNITDKSLIESYLLSKNTGNSIPSPADQEIFSTGAGRLLQGYAAFGFPDRIYTEWISNRKDLSLAESMEASEFLSNFGQKSNNGAYNVQSLRIAARTFENAVGEVPKELLNQTFPRFYKTLIETAAREFNVPEYLMYALVRSESFFDSTVTSKAGANGLTQLMEATADDEARKLKLKDYDIFDPETNIRMGAHYLSSLIGRTDENNELLALYAYNAGLTNVRNWVKRFRSDWQQTGKLSSSPAGISMDLFLESLPFAETREYGRKVISAAAMYAYLYNDKLPGEILREIMY